MHGTCTARSIRFDHEPGNLGFDPLSLKPTGAAELLAMQNAELNNGRLAMIAAAGMIFQETFVSHTKLF
jgi:light-harvesting complex I chlorophyll a/b binding protein 1